MASLEGKAFQGSTLVYPGPKEQFIIDMDASECGIRAVLSLVQDGRERVIVYGSKVLAKEERRYCVT